MSSTVGIRIDPAGWAPAAPAVFVGFRTANGMDGSLASLGLNNKVSWIDQCFPHCAAMVWRRRASNGLPSHVCSPQAVASPVNLATRVPQVHIYQSTISASSGPVSSTLLASLAGAPGHAAAGTAFEAFPHRCHCHHLLICRLLSAALPPTVGQTYNVPGAYVRIVRAANSVNSAGYPVAIVTVTRTK